MPKTVEPLFEIHLAGFSADRLMDSLVGVSGFVSGMTETAIDDLFAAAAIACREDANFMLKLRALIDAPVPQSAGIQALDLATILKIIAALKTLLDLIGQMKGGGGLGGLIPSNPNYKPATGDRCI